SERLRGRESAEGPWSVVEWATKVHSMTVRISLCQGTVGYCSNERTFGFRIRLVRREHASVTCRSQATFQILILSGNIRIVAKKIPKCERSEFVVSTGTHEMYVMSVRPRTRFVKKRADCVIRVRDVQIIQCVEQGSVMVQRL